MRSSDALPAARPLAKSEDQHGQHVVDDRGAQDHAPRPRAKDTEVAEHARRDPNARGGQRRGQEDRNDERRPEEPAQRESAGERERNAQRADGQRRRPDTDEVVEPRLDPDLEEQEYDADLGEERRLAVHLVPAENGGADEDSGQDLPDDWWLADALEDLIADLGREEQDEELAEDLGRVVHAKR